MSGNALRLLPLLALGSASPAFAAENGGLLDPNTGLTAWTIIVFLIVLAVLWKAALPPIIGAVEAREQQIRDLLAAAARDRQEAQEALEQQTRELEETRSRVQELVAEGRASGERMRDDIVADARRHAEEIATRARREVRQELDRALQELRAEAVDLAIAAASKLIERNLDDEDNRRLVREYLAAIESESGAAVPAGV
jgi:F-type H+-transporting ATPase subunit b